MSCKQLQEDFVPCLLGELDRQAVVAIESHLASGCAECRNHFAITREALELVLSTVPAVPLSAEQQQRILQAAVHPALPADAANSMHSNAAGGVAELPDAHSTPWLMAQALLSLAAGFFLMLGWQAWQTGMRPDSAPSGRTFLPSQMGAGATLALPSDPHLLPRSKDKIHFVTVKVPPTQPSVAGYFLADAFSSQLHVVGKLTRMPVPKRQYWLTVATDQTSLEVPLSIDPGGHFKAILPLPEAAIREVSLGAADSGSPGTVDQPR